MAILHACFDESGKLADSQYVVFGGYVSHVIHWEHFSHAWLRALRRHHMKHLHMHDVMRSKSDPTKRDAMLLEFANIINQHTLMATVCPISVNNFKALSAKEKGKLVDPQYVAFETCMRGILRYLEPDMPSETIGVICDDTEQFAMGCYKLMTKLKARHPEMRKRFISLCFADDEEYPPLQAADMWVYTNYQEMLRRMQAPGDAPSKLFETLTKGTVVMSGNVRFGEADKGLSFGRFLKPPKKS